MRKKRLYNFLWFYLIISITIFSLYTLSRYTSTTNFGSLVNVARFNVVVNNVNVEDGKEFDLILENSQKDKTYKNKITPGSNGYFEIIIEPEGTEVELEYKFKFMLDNYPNITIKGYSVNDNDTLKTDFEDNTIKGEIHLPEENGKKVAFSKEDKVDLKVYWECQEEQLINPVIENTNILVNSVINQKIK